MLSHSAVSTLTRGLRCLEASCCLTQLSQLSQVDLGVWKNQAVSLSCSTSTSGLRFGRIMLSHPAASTSTSGLRCLEESCFLTQMSQLPQLDLDLEELCCLTQLSQLPQVDLGLEESCCLTQPSQLPQVDLGVWKNPDVSLSCLNLHKWT